MTYNVLWTLSEEEVFVGTPVFLFLSPSVHAISSVSGPDSATSSVSTPLSISDVQIIGNAASTTPVKLVVTDGVLGITDTGGLSSLSGTTGSTITFTATVADANAALATLTYTRGSVGSDTLEVSLVGASEVFFPENGHLYEYITSSGDWNSANTAASLRTRYSATGYLTTITSQTENDFAAARLNGAGWMGASDAASEDDWRWVTGPESGTQFWSGDEGGELRLVVITLTGQLVNQMTQVVQKIVPSFSLVVLVNGMIYLVLVQACLGLWLSLVPQVICRALLPKILP